MSKEQLGILIGRIRERQPESEPTLAERREEMDAIVKVFPMDPGVTRQAVTVAGGAPGGISGKWIAAPGAAEDQVVLYLHGGGYAMGSVQSHGALVGRLSRAGGVRALAIDYRLAPEHPFPAGLQDAMAAYRWLLEQGIAPEKIVIAGDSAGGGLTLATLVTLRDEGVPLPAGGVCLSPWTDLALTGDSFRTKVDADPMISPANAEQFVKWYVDGQHPKSPLISPLYADLSGLPPLMIQVGTAEILLDDSTRLAERAKAAGVEVVYEAWEDMIHVWHFFAPMLEEGQQAIDAAGAFISAMMN
ncbi:MAG: alpha/beta hydrolase [bacterium]